MSDDDILPEEDELMDRCMRFMELIIDPSMKTQSDRMFRLIRTTVAERLAFELNRDDYSKYPSVFEVASHDRFENQKQVDQNEEQRYVSKVLGALRDKKTVTMAGSRFA